MTHVRKQIRDRFVTTLTGLTTTGSNVYPSRLYPLEDTSLPALRVYTGSEEAEEAEYSGVIGSIGTREVTRRVPLVIEAVAKATSDIDDTLDQICAEVETAMAGDATANGLAHDSRLVSTAFELSVESEQPVGLATLTYEVVYSVTENAPTAAL